MHLLGDQLGKAKIVEAAVGQFRVVAHIAEKSLFQKSFAVYQVTHLQIDWRAMATAAEHPTQQVLLGERGLHQRRRHRIRVEQQIHGVRS